MRKYFSFRSNPAGGLTGNAPALVLPAAGMALCMVFLCGCVPHNEAIAQEPAAAPAPGRMELPWQPKEIADAIEDLSSPEWDVRVHAVRKVCGAGRWIVPFLLVALKNPDPVNRMEAAYCLGRLGDAVAVPSLLEVLDQCPPYDVSIFTIDALGLLGDKSAVEKLKPLLEYTIERDVYVRQLGYYEIKMIESKERTIRHAAAEALSLLGDNSGFEILIDDLADNGWLRRDSAVRLRRLTGCKVDFGFHIDMKDEEITKARESWREWWAKNRETFVPEKGFPRDAVDVYGPRDGKEAGK